MAATSSAEAFAVIGNFEASFVDRVWVKARDGQPIADAAVRTVLARKPVLKQVFIQVSVEGIKVMDSLSYEKQEFVYVVFRHFLICRLLAGFVHYTVDNTTSSSPRGGRVVQPT